MFKLIDPTDDDVSPKNSSSPIASVDVECRRIAAADTKELNATFRDVAAARTAADALISELIKSARDMSRITSLGDDSGRSLRCRGREWHSTMHYYGFYFACAQKLFCVRSTSCSPKITAHDPMILVARYKLLKRQAGHGGHVGDARFDCF